MVTIRTIYSDIYKLCILPTECAHVLRVIITTGSPPVGRYAADIVKDIPLAALCCWLCVVFCRIISLPVSNSLCWYYLFTVTLCTPPPSCSSKIHVAIGLYCLYLSTFVQFYFPLFFFLLKRQRYCLVCISDLPGSNLDRNTDQLHSDFSCFLRVFKQNPRHGTFDLTKTNSLYMLSNSLWLSSVAWRYIPMFLALRSAEPWSFAEQL